MPGWHAASAHAHGGKAVRAHWRLMSTDVEEDM